MKLELPKGTRDIEPEDALIKNEIISKIKEAYERYGYAPLETPTMERAEILGEKAAGDSESLNEWFTLTDQGERKLALRYDFTVPFARYIGMNPTLKLPFKRYTVGSVFRDGPIKLGRFREFTQFDADIVGVKEQSADYEVIEMGLAAYDAIGVKAYFIVNNRKLLDSILEKYEIEKKQWNKAVITLDKLDKIGKKEVSKELEKTGIKKEQVNNLIEAISIEGNNKEKIAFYEKLIPESEGLKEIKELFSYTTDKRIKFQPTLARGFSYYTGTIFEAYFQEGEIKSSIGGGGRYDELVGKLLGNNQIYPCVGFSIGVEVLLTEMKKRKDKQKTPVKAYIIPIGTKKEGMKIAKELREQGIKVDIDLKGKGISKNLNYVNALGIKYSIMLGENEVKAKKVKLRDMKTGKEENLTTKEVIKLLSK